MNSKVITIQETLRIPEDEEFSVDYIADFIDSERVKDEVTLKVDSVSIDYGEGRIKTPFFRSGKEFRDYIERLEKFWCGMK